MADDRSDIDRILHNMQNNVNEIIFGKKEKRSVAGHLGGGTGGGSTGTGMRRRKNKTGATSSTPDDAETGGAISGGGDDDDDGFSPTSPLLSKEGGMNGPSSSSSSHDHMKSNSSDSQGKSAGTKTSSSNMGLGSFLPFLGPAIDHAAVELNQLTSDHLAVVVDGDTLLKIFGDPTLEELFLTIGSISKCVLACRVSPEQKRLAVRLVKKGVPGRPVTLAIGDGANDVAMIQEADIGIGVSGKEGRQAVNTSDFAIAQFRFLKRLLLVHGRLDYRRVCKVILFSFYKNIVLTLILFAFTFNSGYSGQSLFDDWVHSAYNVILAFPVITIGVFDKVCEHTHIHISFIFITSS